MTTLYTNHYGKIEGTILPDGTWSVEVLEVNNHFRRRGCGEELARSAPIGSTLLAIPLYTRGPGLTPDRLIAMYKRAGWELESDKYGNPCMRKTRMHGMSDDQK